MDEFRSGSWDPGRSRPPPLCCSLGYGGHRLGGRPLAVDGRMASKSQPFRPPREQLCCGGDRGESADAMAESADWAGGQVEAGGRWRLMDGFSWKISSLAQAKA